MENQKCIICGVEFTPDAKNRVTCGAPECRRQNQVRKSNEAYHRSMKSRAIQKAARLAIEDEKREARNQQLQSRAKPEPVDPLPGWKSPVEIILDQYPREYHRENGESLNVFEMNQALKNRRLVENEIIRLDGQGTFLVVSAGSRQNLARVPGV